MSRITARRQSSGAVVSCGCDFRRGPRALRMPHRPPRPDRDSRDQHRHAEPEARKQRQLRHFLRDTDAERIDRAERDPDGGRADAHRRGSDRIVAGAAHQQQQHRHQRDDLFPHAFHRPAGRERHATDRHDEIRAMAQHLHQPGHALIEGAGVFDNAEGAADEEDEKDHRRGVGHPLRQGHQRGERSNRALRNSVERAGNDDPPPGRRIIPPLELAGAHQMREHGGSEHTDHEQHERMRNAGTHGDVCARC